MKKIITLLAILLAVSFAFGQTIGSAPTVENVEMRQTGGIVTVTYDLSYDFNPVYSHITLMISNDGGETFRVSIRPEFLEGDVGLGVEAGEARRIIWRINDQYQAHGDQGLVGANFRARVVAKRDDNYDPETYDPNNPASSVPAGLIFVQGTEGVTFDPGGLGYFTPVGGYNVSLSSFYISRFEITQAEWVSVMGGIYEPTWYYNQGPNHPAYYISWLDAIEYCNRRSIMEGLTPVYSYLTYGTNPDDWYAVDPDWNTEAANHSNVSVNWEADGYRLPTEMEREFAARGGVPAANANTFNHRWAGTDDEAELGDYAWYADNNTPAGAKPVGTKLPNELGLYDMSGNVWNLVWDRRDGSLPTGTVTDPRGKDSGDTRVTRGGSWINVASICTVSRRQHLPASTRNYIDGFRVARNLPPPPPPEDPAQARYPIPADEADDVLIVLDSLRWSYIHDVEYALPVYFKVLLTDDTEEWGEVTWAPFNADAEGDRTDYSLAVPADLAYNTTYYWRVIPTTDEPEGGRSGRSGRLSGTVIARDASRTRGDAEDVPTWSFTILDEMALVHGTAGVTFNPGGEGYFNPGAAGGENYNVSLSSFYISRLEVTQSEWLSVMDGIYNPIWGPGDGRGPTHPARAISWFDALEYCNRRSIIQGLTPVYSYLEYGTNPDNWPEDWKNNNDNHTNLSFNRFADGYRLPTEMEREYAARGGVPAADANTFNHTYAGTDEAGLEEGQLGDYAWYRDNSDTGEGMRSHPVGSKLPNELGLYDMSGNVWNWAWDISGAYPEGVYKNPVGPVSGETRLLRGGSWTEFHGQTRVFSRANFNPTVRGHNFGFRIARNATSENPAEARYPLPADEDDNVLVVLDSLRWSYVRDVEYATPANFKVLLTDDPEEWGEVTWVPFNADAEGDRTDYALAVPANLAYNTTYYWRVIPTTDEPEGGRSGRSRRLSGRVIARDASRTRGDAEDVPTWSFTTLEEMVLVQGTAGVTFNPGGEGYFTPGGSYNVSLSPFYISRLEVTQSEWLSVMDGIYNPNWTDRGQSDYHPAYRISWFDAIEYCNRRSMMEGLTPVYSYLEYGTNPDNWPEDWNSTSANQTNVSFNRFADGYRLPTEMEHHYAGRGGVPAASANTFNHRWPGTDEPEELGDYAWYSDNSDTGDGMRSHPVGSKLPNELGLYDMSGNVQNQVWDIHGAYPAGSYTNPTGPISGDRSVMRGGAYSSGAGDLRFSIRWITWASLRRGEMGFRVVRNGPPSENPDKASYPLPADEAENVSVELDSLRWSYIRDVEYSTPANFKVLFTDDTDEWGEVTWVPFNADAEGDRTDYAIAVPTDLAYNTTYYWRVIPTTDEPEGGRSGRSRRLSGTVIARDASRTRGDAEDVTTWSFTTQVIPVPNRMIFVQGTAGVTFNPGGEGYFTPAAGYNVSLSSFHISEFDVTQTEWTSVMGGIHDPDWNTGQGSNHPAYRISWFNAIDYCNRLSIMEGLTPVYSYSEYGTNPDNWPAGWDTVNGNHNNISCNWDANGYRLPTEMEREYAARGGVPAAQGNTFNHLYAGTNELNDLGDYAWYNTNSGGSTHHVGTKLPNELGLYDMSGNIRNWIWDRHGAYPTGSFDNPKGPDSGADRVRRGGCYAEDASSLTVSWRLSGGATTGGGWMGFRVARNAAPEPEGMVFIQGTAGVTFNPGGQGYFNPGAAGGENYNVSLSSFYLSRFEVTQAEWISVMDGIYNPDWSDLGQGPNHPAYRVSWFNAIEYCNRRSIIEGLEPCYSYAVGETEYGTNPNNWPAGWKTNNANHTNVSCNWNANGYRLPTEMEREYAARGGVPATNTNTFNHTYAGTDEAGLEEGQLGDYAWYWDNSNTGDGMRSHPVGSKLPNELGLYDMSGNVWNWVWDISGAYPTGNYTNPTGVATGNRRVIRGGGFFNEAPSCAVYTSLSDSPRDGWAMFGFRVARNVPPPTPEGMVFIQGTAGVTFSPGGEEYFTPVTGYNVSLSSFYMSIFEITQSEWTSVMDGIYNPVWNLGQGPNYPAYRISWFDAIEYCNRRSIMEGLTPCYSYDDGTDHGTNPDNWPTGWNTNDANHVNVSCNWDANGYRLPTEMEREYAARGGVPAANSNTFNHRWAGTDIAGTGAGQLGDYAWYRDNASDVGSSHPDYGIHPVGTKLPNELGLYDMSGNVVNWVWDRRDGDLPTGTVTDPKGKDSGTFRVQRGGSWIDFASNCRVSSRISSIATNRDHIRGFRVSRTLN